MFPTFTGKSRRSRKVNLSGQKQANPFAAHALSPTSGSAASKTVAEAQATRRRRQQERDELKAAQTIQRVWRGHSARQACRRDRYQQLRALYAPGRAIRRGQRVLQALPLVLASVGTRSDDRYNGLLCFFANDLRVIRNNMDDINRLGFHLPKVAKLVNILLDVLDRNRDFTTVQAAANVITLVSLAQLYPHTLFDGITNYYKLLALFYDKNEVLSENDKESLVQEAVLIPMMGTPDERTGRAYCQFASVFLPYSLHPFDTMAQAISHSIAINTLSQSIIFVYGKRTENFTETPDQLLRLLARYLDLVRHAEPENPSSVLYLSAVYTVLSYASGRIRPRLAKMDDDVHSGDERSKAEQKYFAAKIQYLVGKGEITALVEKLTVSQARTSGQNQASSLAGYATTLIQCFPSRADDIRMQCVLADLPKDGILKPSVRFYWDECKTSPSFKRVLDSPRAAYWCIAERRWVAPTTLVLESRSEWVQEWRTILLFLELYTFILRLTDDDDFCSALATPESGFEQTGPQPVSVSRLRSCALPLHDLKILSTFLQNLAFALYFNAPEILGTRGGTIHRHLVPGTINTTTVGFYPSGVYEVISGLDFNTFRSTVTTALQMLYERDSRCQFFDADHWLMNAGLHLDHVLDALILEDRHRQELLENGLDIQDIEEASGSGNIDDDDDDDDDEEEEEEEEEPRRIVLNGRLVPSMSRAEQLRRPATKARRKHIKEITGPAQQMLRNMPFVFLFESRVIIFRKFVEMDKIRRRGGSSDPDLWRSRMRHRPNELGEHEPARLRNYTAVIRRDNVFESAFEQFWDLGEGLKEPIQITFIDEYGHPEAGIGGGVTKEFLTNALTQVLSPEEELFQCNKENSVFPNPMSLDQLKHRLRSAGEKEGTAAWDQAVAGLLKRYEFIGRMIGKCMYEGILLDFVFAGFFLLKWTLSETSTDGSTGYRASVNDLREMDEDLYQGMMKLKNYSGADVSDLDIDFTIEDQVSGSKDERLETVTRNLIPNGANVRVTNQNRPLYISYVARHRLLAQPYAVTRAFLKGLGAIIDPAWLRMFNQHELQRLVGGDSSEIDVEDMRRNTVYSGVYEIGDDKEEHPTIKLFWKVVQDMDDKDRRLLLKYATSTPRAPLLGFAQLNPLFSIRFGGVDETRLPSASTCMNLLKLPMYTTEETLREKLIYAIRANVGFGFT